MSIKNPDWERNHRLQMGLLQVALKSFWSGSVVISYSDLLGQCFFKSFVGICSSAGIEELHPHNIRDCEEDQILSVQLTQLLSCLKELCTRCYHFIWWRSPDEKKQKRKAGRTVRTRRHVKMVRQDSFNSQPGPGGQQMSCGVTADSCKQHMQMQGCFVAVTDWCKGKAFPSSS